MERLNWPVVVFVTVVGFGAVLGGVHLGGWNADTFSGVLVEIGAAIGLASALVIVERRVVRRVAVTAARDEAERVTQDLRARVDRLEDLDDAQRDLREMQRRAADEQFASIRDGEITSQSIGRAVVDAIREQLIDPGQFVVRTGAVMDSPVIHVLPFVQAGDEVVALYLDFEAMTVASEPVLVDGKPVPVPEKSESTVMWTDESASSIGAELQAGLERRNVPTEHFGFGYAIDRLLKSIEVMRFARGAPAGSPTRLEGRLRVLINDDWAYTTKGLEATQTTVVHPLRYAGSMEGISGSGPFGPHMVLSSTARDEADAALSEALDWVEHREAVRLIEPGTDPMDAFFSRRRDW